MTSRASFGRLKLVLRLELPLPGPRPGVDDRPPCVPALENDVRREGGRHADDLVQDVAQRPTDDRER